MPNTKTLFTGQKYGLGRRLLVYILLFSSLVTLIGTSIQLYADYSKDRRLLDERMKQIETSYLEAITNAMWISNAKLLNTQLNGILQLPDIEYLDIQRDGRVITNVGKLPTENSVSHKFQILYTYKNRRMMLGMLNVVASLDGIHQRTFDRILIILMTQGIKAFLVSIFIFFIFYALVGRHLTTLAAYASSLDMKTLGTPFRLNRPPRKEEKEDELGLIESSINKMRVKLYSSYEEIQKEALGRKKAEVTIRKSEEQFRTISEVSTVAICMTDTEGKCLYANPLWLSHAGMTLADALGDGWSKGLHPDDLEALFSSWGNMVQSKGQWGLEYRLLTPEGEITWVYSTANAIKDDAGNTAGYVTVNIDITERKEAEEKLRRAYIEVKQAQYAGINIIEDLDNQRKELEKSKEGLAEAQRLAQIGNWEIDLVKNDLSWSAEVYRIFELDPGEFGASYEAFVDAIHPEERDFVNKAYADSVKNKTPYDIVHRLLMKDGSVKHVHEICETFYDERGNPIRSTGTIQDITERVRTDEIIRDIATGVSAQTGEAFFQSAVLHLTKLFDADEAFIGLLDERMPGTVSTFALCAHGEIADNITYSLADTPCANVVGHSTCVYTSRVQQQFPKDQLLVEMGAESYVGSPLLDMTGKPIGLIVVMDNKPMENAEQVRNILEIFAARAATEVERLKAEEELRKHREHLEELVKERTGELAAVNKELEAFSYSISHDLRAPLRSIDGFSQALLDDYDRKLDEGGKHMLKRLRANSQNMAELIDDMLDLSRLTRKEMHRQEIDLSALAHDIINDLQEADSDHRVKFAVTDGAVVNGDPILLKAMMGNLLGNAWKFTGKRKDAIIEFGVTRQDGNTVYFVRDNGAGFDMAYADKLFGTFQRLHSESEFSGTGVGLATVQRIIHRHGGKVWAEAEVNKGATFYFTL